MGNRHSRLTLLLSFRQKKLAIGFRRKVMAGTRWLDGESNPSDLAFTFEGVKGAEDELPFRNYPAALSTWGGSLACHSKRGNYSHVRWFAWN
jgi:hypothetical protein